MAYVTGIATSVADILAAIQSACTANGWTLSGEVLHKSTCYVRVAMQGESQISICGGTGIDGNNNLTGGAPNINYFGAGYSPAMTFPATYHIHVLDAPGEVYVFVNYAVTGWQWLAWGQSNAFGAPGSGIWFGGPMYKGSGYSSPYPTTSGGGSGNGGPAILFWPGSNHSVGHIDHGFADSGSSGWSTSDDDYAADALHYASVLMTRQPSAWNNEAVLAPITPFVSRPGGMRSLVTTLAHARFIRNDYHDDGDVITLGADQWKVYPWIRKDANARNGGEYGYSGTLAVALRYDGP